MSWEALCRGSVGRNTVRALWWDDPNTMGVCFTKAHMYFNKALLDILKAEKGTPIMVFVDKKNDQFAIRTAREGEMYGAYVLGCNKDSNTKRCAAAPKLFKVFAWCKPGGVWKAELGDGMVVVRNKL